jgi:hypothetical protein
MSADPRHLSWLGIVRLGLVQASLGSVVALTTTTFNRIMVVELALPALLPGLLVAIHYAMGALRPRWGHGSDRRAAHALDPRRRRAAGAGRAHRRRRHRLDGDGHRPPASRSRCSASC